MQFVARSSRSGLAVYAALFAAATLLLLLLKRTGETHAFVVQSLAHCVPSAAGGSSSSTRLSRISQPIDGNGTRPVYTRQLATDSEWSVAASGKLQAWRDHLFESTALLYRQFEFERYGSLHNQSADTPR